MQGAGGGQASGSEGLGLGLSRPVRLLWAPAGGPAPGPHPSTPPPRPQCSSAPGSTTLKAGFGCRAKRTSCLSPMKSCRR